MKAGTAVGYSYEYIRRKYIGATAVAAMARRGRIIMHHKIGPRDRWIVKWKGLDMPGTVHDTEDLRVINE